MPSNIDPAPLDTPLPMKKRFLDKFESPGRIHAKLHGRSTKLHNVAGILRLVALKDTLRPESTNPVHLHLLVNTDLALLGAKHTLGTRHLDALTASLRVGPP